MKVKVIKEAWYKKRRIKEDDVIEFYGDKLPSWAVAIEPAKGRSVSIPQTSQQAVQQNYQPSQPTKFSLGGVLNQIEKPPATNKNIPEDNPPERDPNPYNEIKYENLKTLARERNLVVKGNPSRPTLEDMLLKDDENRRDDEELSTLTVEEIATLADKKFGCKLNTNESRDMVIDSYKNAKKVFIEKSDNPE